MSEPIYDNEIECAQCGTSFFHELTRCPNCGASVYPLDSNPLDSSGERWQNFEVKDPLNTFAKVSNSAAVVFAGLFVASLITLSPYFFIKRFISPSDWLGMQVLIFTMTIIGALGGGFIAARFSKHRAAEEQHL